jgi:LysR family hydrogen peroxide-inducible transcriptional activator
MELRQLHVLVAIEEHGSFSAAADALATVQSNVSTHVKKLERELGIELVDRSTGQVTEAGELVVARARRVMSELDAMTSDVTALSHEVAGTVRLGIIGTAARWLVPQLIELAPERYPLLHLVFVESTTLGLDIQLANGQVDLGVLGLPAPQSELRTVPLFEEDLVLALPRDHPLAANSIARLVDLVELPLILPLRGVAFRDELDAVAAANRITLQPRAEVDSLRLIASLSLEGSGYAILPAGAAARRRMEGWALIPVEGLTPRVVGVAQRRRGLPGAPVRAVLEFLQEIISDPTRVPWGVRPIQGTTLTPPRFGEASEPIVPATTEAASSNGIRATTA